MLAIKYVTLRAVVCALAALGPLCLALCFPSSAVQPSHDPDIAMTLNSQCYRSADASYLQVYTPPHCLYC